MHFKQKYSYTADVLLEVDKIKDLQDENSLCKLCVQLFIFFCVVQTAMIEECPVSHEMAAPHPKHSGVQTLQYQIGCTVVF